MDSTLLTLLTDIALGGMAYHLALRLSKVQERQTAILSNQVLPTLQDHEDRLKKLENG